MVKRASIEFVQANEPIKKPVTKFGGQPIWLSEPEWPISPSTERPMQFICQIELLPEIFGEPSGRMAYLFMTVAEEDDYVDGTWDPEGGENAVIIQPKPLGRELSVTTDALIDGPTLYSLDKKTEEKEPVEFAVKLTPSEDPDFVDAAIFLKWEESRRKAHTQTLSGNKLGGTPLFIQDAEFPLGLNSKLLLQLDSTAAPFHIDFGDAGVGYVFISEDGSEGKFLWQCL
jgi:uncharacterized protein YwqG